MQDKCDSRINRGWQVQMWHGTMGMIMNLIMEIETSNVNDDFSDTGGESVSVTVLGAASKNSRLGLGWCSRCQQNSWRIVPPGPSFCTCPPQVQALMSPYMGCCVPSYIHGMQGHCWCWLASLLPCVLQSRSSSAFLSCQIHPSCHVTRALATLHLFCCHTYLSSKWRWSSK